MHHVCMGWNLCGFTSYMCVVLWKNDDDEGKKPNRFLTQLFKEDCTAHKRWL